VSGVGSPLGSVSAFSSDFTGLVFGRVVPPAEEDAFGYVGFSAVGPVVEVVDVAPAGVSVASWSLAVAVSGDDGSALGDGPCPCFSSYVEDFGVGSEDDPADRGVTGELAERFDVDDVSVEGLVGASGYPL
jgi:hypothetical protein